MVASPLEFLVFPCFPIGKRRIAQESLRARLGRKTFPKGCQKDAQKVPKRSKTPAKRYPKTGVENMAEKSSKKGDPRSPKASQRWPRGPQMDPKSHPNEPWFCPCGATGGTRGENGAKKLPKGAPKAPRTGPKCFPNCDLPHPKDQKRPLQKQLRKRTPSTPRTKRNNSNNNNS